MRQYKEFGAINPNLCKNEGWLDGDAGNTGGKNTM